MNVDDVEGKGKVLLPAAISSGDGTTMVRRPRLKAST